MAPGFQRLLSSIDTDGNGRDVLFVFMTGHEHYYMGLSDYGVPYDFSIADRPDLPIQPEHQVIPLDTIRAQVAFYLKDAIANFSAIRACQPGLRVINVVCPPPIRAEHAIQTSSYPMGTSLAAAANHALRLKYYLVYVQALTEAAARLNIESMMPPEEATDAEGMLRQEYAKDNIHGNSRYGQAVLAKMNELLQSR
jgi:hypothetical protein